MSVDGNTIPQPTISPMFAFAPKGEPNPADLNNLCKKRKPSFVKISYIRFEIPLPTTEVVIPKIISDSYLSHVRLLQSFA